MKLVSRKNFVRSLVTVGGVVLLPFCAGCSDDDDDGGNGNGSTNGNGRDDDAGVDASSGGPSDGGEGATDAGDAAVADGSDARDAGEMITECAAAVALAEQHIHEVIVPAEDVRAGLAMTYILSLVAGHTHDLTVTAGMMQSLAEGETLMVASSVDSGHSHSVAIVCTA